MQFFLSYHPLSHYCHITAPPIKVSNIDEDMEELTNEISGGSARQQVNDEAVRTERLTSFSFSHPGIMAGKMLYFKI